MSAIQFSVAGIDVQVACDGPEVEGSLSVLTSCFPPPAGERPTLSYHCKLGHEPALWCNESRVATAAEAVDLAPLFELDLYQRIPTLRTDGIWLHAAAVAGEHGALVLTGASGCGKTTLAYGLTLRNHRYITDEHTFITPSGEVSGLCRPLAIPESVDLAAGWHSHAFPWRDASGKLQTARQAQPPTTALCHRPQPLAAVVFIAYRPEQPTRIERIAPRAAFSELWCHALRRNRNAFDAAVAMANTTRFFRLQSESVEAACTELAQLT